MRKIHWQALIHGLVVVVSFSSGVARAGGPLPFTQEWYEMRADDPPGARQVYKDGKYWPPYPRAQGRKQTLVHGYHTAHYWPHPYDCQDRADVSNLFQAQAGAGWAAATTLHDYHFDADTQQLTDAGQNHLIWVANSVPAQYRTLYISQGKTPAMGQLRVAEAEKYMQEMGFANVPPIVAKFETFNGRPANEVDRLRTLELLSIPRPRLFLIGVAGRQSGGAGSGAGAGGGMGMGGGGGGSGSGQGGSTTTQGSR